MDKELEKLENELAAIKAKINQTIGQRDSILKRMKADFGVATIKEAKVKITELEASEAACLAKFEELKKEYEALCQ